MIAFKIYYQQLYPWEDCHPSDQSNHAVLKTATPEIDLINSHMHTIEVI